ncbi:DUF1223 domain-containing protein [Gluconacetobacter diazotrophicus]|uniref:DUF1223 domain-containing protein n=1 Tax=Gluconacetobacter diazotrophicus (strain ATCC 49037 / DSM 5601 / CCUG 37298 / CIP 103539 / LMG 7603 / PAl5) TaxID=272568 RepID=A9HQA0_GLUDA|nr:DUF1223 domain-containing protein [Gluconacetobacter diazotrophicus]CAP56701.1 conserved hypothetical protein [Gluconacetobacter diazotrophicus PA1 5]
MKLKSVISTALGGMLALVGTSVPAMAADPDHPTVVELFQSQGCSSCPPANANLLALSDRPDLLTLSWEVTYWDDLGWKNTFSALAFTARQRNYAHAFRRREVFTPEIVVIGTFDDGSYSYQLPDGRVVVGDFRFEARDQLASGYKCGYSCWRAFSSSLLANEWMAGSYWF